MADDTAKPEENPVHAGMLRLQVVTPEAEAVHVEADAVTLPTASGEIQVLAGHMPLVSRLVPGEMVVRSGGKDSFLAVGRGIIMITGDHISILTDLAVEAEHIDEAAAETARREAEARLQEQLSQEEIVTIKASLAKALALLEVKHRHDHHGRHQAG